jgi:diguanylate cyclase (GGDEF)-like protein
MSQAPEKDQVLADYSVFLAALWPESGGFVCHDRHGRRFWGDGGAVVDELTGNDDYCRALDELLASPASEGRAVVRAGERSAYLMSLDDNAGVHHGVLTVISAAGSDIDADTVYKKLRPALRTLRRELTLRYRLIDARRKLAVQAAEEKLLHHVESVAQHHQDSTATLTRILELCSEYLNVAEVGVQIPSKQIQLLVTKQSHAEDVSVRLAALLDPAADDAQLDRLVLPVGSEASGTVGQLVLAGWGESGFSGRRRRRLARYIASHVKAAVERDFDALTGLLGWPIFEARLATQCQVEGRDQCVLMYLDVDQLQVINQNYGRAMGDRVLSKFAGLLQERLNQMPVSRITSDSFAALVPSGDREFVRQLGEEICERFHELAFESEGKPFHASVSIGIAPLQTGEEASSETIAAAQVACRAAKERGAGRVEIYEPTDRSIVQRLGDIQLVGRVREAIEEGRLLLLGQPIRAIRNSSKLDYLEVLVRMLDDQGRPVEPVEFISAAERYQLMKELDRWVVSRSLRTLSECGLAMSADRVRLAINLSGQSLGDEQFLDFVREQLLGSDIDPQIICFEITETVAVANMQRAQGFMHALKRMGCRFSLDDFGTGLSSFAYLKLFPVETLKIDGSFVRDLASNKVSQSVVAAISEVARVMELETVAEFVQDDDSLSLLRELGVDWGQGYLLGQPASLEQVLSEIGEPPRVRRSTQIVS